MKMWIEGRETEFEIDTGASVSLISEKIFRELETPKVNQRRPARKLRTYTGEEIPVLGEWDIEVCYGGISQELPVIVVKGSGPCLLGRDWLQAFKLDWASIFVVAADSQANKDVEKLLQDCSELFSETRGTIHSTKASIQVDPTSRPRYFKPRPVPYALREKVGLELDRLEAEGTIEKVAYSDWAAPIVTVVKPDMSIRICGDYKVTVNAVSKLDNYPIPKTDDLLAELGGGKYFSKLDLTQAYQQLELEEDSKQFTTINTHQGLYRFHRLPFGISSAPGIFQRTMENLLKGIPNVLVRIDDILLAGKSREEHLKCLKRVLERLRDSGARLKRKKCVFLASEVVYLGLKIDATGIHPVQEKVKAIEDMPRPQDVKQLQAYLGMLQYYARFLPHLSTVLAPFHSLLQKGVPWEWRREQEQAWIESKSMLQSPKVLVHFDSTKELILTCDASSYGVAAVLSHRMSDGTEKPVAFASRTMNSAEKNYSQVEKEALAIVFGVRKFHQYLYGKKFEIQTDHKPLLGLFRENKQIPSMSAARIQRWALTLAAYEYTITFKKGILNCNADGLSRLPRDVTVEPEPAETVLMIDQQETMPITAQQVKDWTKKDPVLSQVLGFVQAGWPSKTDAEELKPFFSKQAELSVQDGCLLWGGRVIVPVKGRKVVLQDLHEGHPGASRMKSLARSYFWWPGMDRNIEDIVKGCSPCQLNRNRPSVAPLHPWEWPSRPWARLHIDYAGPFLNKMFLVVVDAHSKWLEAFPMANSTSEATIDKLRQIFATHGLPETIVSDNGTCFTSAAFRTFLKQNGIEQINSAPYHPSTNGLAERGVQILKQGLKKMKTGSLETRVSRLLAAYRMTPHSTTGVSPAELLLGRKVRTRFDLAKPSIETRVLSKQSKQKAHHDTATEESTFTMGEPVYVKNFAPGPKWLEAVIARKTGPLSYLVELARGNVQRRHVDQVLRRTTSKPLELEQEEFHTIPRGGEQTDKPVVPPTSPLTAPTPEPIVPASEPITSSEPMPTEPALAELSGSTVLRRSTRTRTRPAKLQDFV